ncbi:MAG: hypothetical protein V2I43_04750 [Parvularcula sp.]|nr:hypothetical protein [Parvularcula sp.]
MREDPERLRRDLYALVDELVSLSEQTDPRHEVPEKAHLAYSAMELCWRIFDRGANWAQRHVIGVEYTKHLTDWLQEKAAFDSLMIGPDEFDDNHRLIEVIPLLFENEWHFCCGIGDAEDFIDVDGGIPSGELPPSERRSYLANLLRSRSVGSYVWRNELAHNLLAVNDGSTLELFKTTRKRGMGNSYEARIMKRIAVAEVVYEAAKPGGKKKDALAAMAETLGRDVETIRDWEKAVRKDDEGIWALKVAEFAGVHEPQLRKGLPHAINELSHLDAVFKSETLVRSAIQFVDGVGRIAGELLAYRLRCALAGLENTPRAVGEPDCWHDSDVVGQPARKPPRRR